MTNGDASYNIVTDKHYETIVSTVKKIAGMSSVTDAQRKGLDTLLTDIQGKPVKTRHDIIKIADAIDKLHLPDDCQFETGLFYTLGFEASAISTGAHAQKEADNAYLRGKLVDWNTRRIVKEIEADADLSPDKKQEHIDYFTQLNQNAPLSASEALAVYEKADKRYKARGKNGLPESLLNEVVFFQYVAQSANPADVIHSIVGAPAAAEQKLGVFLNAFERMRNGEAFDPSTLPRELRDDFGRYFAGLSKYIADEKTSREKIRKLERANKELRDNQKNAGDNARAAKKYTDLSGYVTALSEALLTDDTKELKDGLEAHNVPLYQHNKEDYADNPDEYPGNPALVDKRTLASIVKQLVQKLSTTEKARAELDAAHQQLAAQHDETKGKLTVAEARASEAEAQKTALQTKYDTDVAAKNTEVETANAKAKQLQATLDSQTPDYDTLFNNRNELFEKLNAQDPSYETVKAELAETKEVAGGLETLMTETTADRDRAVQEEARLGETVKLQKERLAKYEGPATP